MPSLVTRRETGSSHLGGCSISEVNKDSHGKTGHLCLDIGQTTLKPF